MSKIERLNRERCYLVLIIMRDAIFGEIHITMQLQIITFVFLFTESVRFIEFSNYS